MHILNFMNLTLQPALAFSVYIDHLVAEIASIIACLLGSSQNLNLGLFDMKILPVVTYGMSCMGQKLSLAAVEPYARTPVNSAADSTQTRTSATSHG